MGQFKPMVKMMTTEPTVELKLKKGGSVKKADGGMMAMPSAMSAMPARGGMMPVARPKRPSMAARRAAMAGATMKNGGESKATHKAEMSKMKGLEKELKSHESKPASKGHKGLATGGIAKSTKPGGYATGGVVNGQGGYKKGGKVKMASGGNIDNDVSQAKSGLYMQKDDDKVYSKVRGLGPGMAAKRLEDRGVDVKGLVGNRANPEDRGSYKKGGIINTEGQGGAYRNTKMVTATPDNNSAPTGKVKLGNGGGYKKGGATKKHYATGGAVNDSGRAVAYPAKKPSASVSNDRQSGTFKKGGSVTPAQKKEQSFFKAENATAMKQAKAQSNLKYQDGGKVTDLSKGAYDKSIGPSESDMDMAKAIRNIPSKLMEGAKSLFGSGTMSNKDRDAVKNAGSVTKTEKSVTVSPAKKRGGSVKC
jgi:hypothetical protein